VGPGPRARSWSAAFGEGEETYYRRRWHAPHVAVRLLHTWRSTPKEYDSWARAPVPETGSPWRASGDVFCGALGHQWGNPSLKRDSPRRGSHSHQRPFALEFSALLCRRSRHGLARPSRAPLARGGTQLGAQPARMGRAEVCRKDPCRSLLTATLPPESLCSSSPNSPVGWRCRSYLSSCCCWRGLASSLYMLQPASSFRRPSSPTSMGCPWRRRSFPLLPPASEGKDDHQPCEGGQRVEPRVHPSRPTSLGWEVSRAAAPSLWLSWPRCHLQHCLPPLSGAWLPVQRTGDGRTVRRSVAPAAPPAPPATVGHVMKTSTLLMHLYQYKYQFLVPLLALVLVNSTIR
jgi:hypothetical protein